MIRLFIGGLLTVCTIAANSLAATDLSEPPMATGIYFDGKSQSGRVTIEGSEAPAELFPCVNCHGERAEGKREGGIMTPNITRHQLQQNFRRGLQAGNRRAAFDADTFMRALVEGISPDGSPLDSRMPRYQLTKRETDSLFEFLGEINKIHPKGVNENAIRVGIRLPQNRELSTAMDTIVQAYGEKINSGHGIYGRKLHFVDSSDAEISGPVFCILDLSLDHDPADVQEDILISVFSKNSGADNQYALYQHPLGYARQSTELAVRESWQLIPITENNFQDLIINHTRSNFHAENWPVFQVDARRVDVPAFFRLLNTQGRVEKVLLMNQMEPVDHPLIKQYPGDVYVLQPPGPESVSPTGRSELIELIESNDPDNRVSDYLPAKLWALAALSLLTESLESAGHDLTGSRFEKALQQQVDFDNPFGPRLSYSATKRIGSMGIQAVKLN